MGHPFFLQNQCQSLYTPDIFLTTQEIEHGIFPFNQNILFHQDLFIPPFPRCGVTFDPTAILTYCRASRSVTSWVADAQFQITPNISDPAGCCNISYRSETHTELKSREISFAHNSLLSCQIVLKFCTEHGSITVVPFANFENELTTEVDVMDDRNFVIFEFKCASDGYHIFEQPRELSFVRILPWAGSHHKTPILFQSWGELDPWGCSTHWPLEALCEILAT